MELIQALNGLTWPAALVLLAGIAALACVMVAFIRGVS
jgi:hypothetical protein